MSYQEWFSNFAGNAPHAWQRELAGDEACSTRMIRIPTGFGKTLGAVGCWAYHRVARRQHEWPRRLVYCLPMRTLVEQTESEVRAALERAGILRTAENPAGVAVHVLMGGITADDWHLDVTGDAVLLGTQDMLLSRALNRGYGAARARWPVEFGLLHTDALWVFDEVQLMDVGLATSAQLAAFRAGDATLGRELRPSATWWMSATLQPRWLQSVDSAALIAASSAKTIRVAPALRQGSLWTDVSKPVELVAVGSAKQLASDFAAQLVARLHSLPDNSLTLVVLNTVRKAVETWQEIARRLPADGPDLRLVHSQFRPAERRAWREDFLSKSAAIPRRGRVIVATQVIEAGVDLDAQLLITELAPWPSLVQRFGRAARRGGTASVVVLDPQATDDKAAAPYAEAEISAARAVLAMGTLVDVAPLHLERFEEDAAPELLRTLYPYHPAHLLLRRELDDLFDTTPDLTGADIDISRFIRSGDERDCTIAWLDAGSDGPAAAVQPARDELCPAPFLRVRDWLCEPKTDRLKAGTRAWVWDWIDGAWRTANRKDLVPGRVVVVDRGRGGYSAATGFDPVGTAVVPLIPPGPMPTCQDVADGSQDGEALSEFAYKTIATHGREVAAEVDKIAQGIGLDAELRSILALAGQWHDVGKSHPNFQGCIAAVARPGRTDLAKAPRAAWPRGNRYRNATTGERRPGFRHELASALAMFSVLELRQPNHMALLGPWAEFLQSEAGLPATQPPTPAEQTLLDLEAEGEFDLACYLVASHHGKVRTSLTAAPADQEYRAKDGRGQPIRGVREGDRLPPILLDSDSAPLPELTLTLEPAVLGLSARTGASWSERVQGLLRQRGPFALAFLEACLRAADVRASQWPTPDPLLADTEGEP